LDRLVESGRTPAEDMLDQFHGAWNDSVDPVYDQYAF